MLVNKIRSIVCQLERSQNNGQLHIHGALGFTEQYRPITKIKKLMPGCHIEVAKSHTSCESYCSKEYSRVYGPFYFGIRPENITILPFVKEEDLQVIRAKVSFVEPIGPSSIVYAHADGQRIQTICSTDTEFNSGDAIYLKFQTDHLHLFNHETGEALI